MAPGRRGAAARRRARRGEGAAASARSKCSRSLRRFPRRSPRASGRQSSSPRSLRRPGADLQGSPSRERKRFRGGQDREHKGQEGAQWGEGVPKEETPAWGEGHARNPIQGISERERSGESAGGGSHTYSGDLGVPPWSGKPGLIRGWKWVRLG